MLITGASSGIGEALAHEAAKQGAKLALGARRLDKLHQLSKALPLTTTAFTDLLDVRSPQSIENFVQKSLQHLGGLDVVIANAGLGVVGSFEKLTIEDYKRQFDTNVWGVIETIKACLPSLKLSRGRVVIIGSVNSYVSFPGSSPYSMSKYSVRALAESLHHELSVYGISTTLICPGMSLSALIAVLFPAPTVPEKMILLWRARSDRIEEFPENSGQYRRTLLPLGSGFSGGIGCGAGGFG